MTYSELMQLRYSNKHSVVGIVGVTGEFILQHFSYNFIDNSASLSVSGVSVDGLSGEIASRGYPISVNIRVPIDQIIILRVEVHGMCSSATKDELVSLFGDKVKIY